MSKGLRRIRDAGGVALIWAALWTGAGAWIGAVDSADFMRELWLGPPIGMLPGLAAGAMFSAVIAANRRRLEEWSLFKIVALGGMAGLLVGVLPFAINEPKGEVALWRVAAVVIGSMTLLGATSAAGSLALARTIAVDPGRRVAPVLVVPIPLDAMFSSPERAVDQGRDPAPLNVEHCQSSAAVGWRAEADRGPRIEGSTGVGNRRHFSAPLKSSQKITGTSPK